MNVVEVHNNITLLSKIYCRKMTLKIELFHLLHYHPGKTNVQKSISYNFSLLRIFLMLITVEAVICIRKSEKFSEIQNNDGRYKRQIQGEESSTRGHASVIA